MRDSKIVNKWHGFRRLGCSHKMEVPSPVGDIKVSSTKVFFQVQISNHKCEVLRLKGALKTAKSTRDNCIYHVSTTHSYNWKNTKAYIAFSKCFQDSTRQTGRSSLSFRSVYFFFPLPENSDNILLGWSKRTLHCIRNTPFSWPLSGKRRTGVPYIFQRKPHSF